MVVSWKLASSSGCSVVGFCWLLSTKMFLEGQTSSPLEALWVACFLQVLPPWDFIEIHQWCYIFANDNVMWPNTCTRRVGLPKHLPSPSPGRCCHIRLCPYTTFPCDEMIFFSSFVVTPPHPGGLHFSVKKNALGQLATTVQTEQLVPTNQWLAMLN